MAFYRKKPVVVEAEQFWPEKKPWPKGVSKGTGCMGEGNIYTTYVTTIHEQQTRVVAGDWIIIEPDGSHAYPCKPDIFEATYELVLAEMIRPEEIRGS